MAWNELFENIMASNGLGMVLEKKLIFIARAEDLGALDLMLVAHDLAITRVEPPDSRPGTTTLRISKLADVKGETVDLSTLPPTPISNS